jgi:hypothetical protein
MYFGWGREANLTSRCSLAQRRVQPRVRNAPRCVLEHGSQGSNKTSRKAAKRQSSANEESHCISSDVRVKLNLARNPENELPLGCKWLIARELLDKYMQFAVIP